MQRLVGQHTLELRELAKELTHWKKLVCTDSALANVDSITLQAKEQRTPTAPQRQPWRLHRIVGTSLLPVSREAECCQQHVRLRPMSALLIAVVIACAMVAD